jgi:phosphatidylglycerol:prolipoprotein diacylglycerol transferase
MASGAKKENFNPIDVFLVATIGAGFMIAGAKISSLVEFFIKHFPEILNDPLYLRNWNSSGGYYFGAFAGLALFFLIYVRKFFKNQVLNFMDICSVSLPLGQAIGRLGCFMSGCCYGKPTGLPWGLKFTFHGSNQHPWSDIALHPTQIYEFILNIFNFIFLFYLAGKKKYDGQLFSQYLINYGIIRFILEYFRGDVIYILMTKSSLTSITLFQTVSLILILSGIVSKKYLKKKAEQKP